MRNVLVLSGGGPRGSIILGCLEYLRKIGQLKKYRTMVSSGIGAIISVLLACRFTPIEILNYIFREQNIYNFKLTLGLSLLNKGGIHNVDNLIDPITELIQTRLNAIPTMKQIYDSGYDLNIAAANINQSQTVYFNSETHPNLLCTDVLKLACGVPILFSKVTYSGEYYCDAGIDNNVPIMYPRRYNAEEVESILCIDVTGTRTTRESSDVGFWQYLQLMVNYHPISNHRNDTVDAIEIYGSKLTTIDFPSLLVNNIFNMYVNPGEVEKLYTAGYGRASQVIGIEPSDIREVDQSELPQPQFPSEEEDEPQHD